MIDEIYTRQKEELEKKLIIIEKTVKNLQSQRIDNPKSAYSHPVLKAYLEQQESSKQSEANDFVKKIQEEKKSFEEKKKKIELQVKARILQEEQDKLAKEARIKIQLEKEKEEQLKIRIKDIEYEKTRRIRELEDHQEKYKHQTEKMNNGKQPLYMRLSKKYHSQKKLENQTEQKNIDDIRDSHKRIDEMNLFEHQQKYLDKLKAQEEERLQERKKHQSEMKEQLAKLSSLPQSSLWNQSKDEASFNSPMDQKLRSMKIVEARNHFADGVKKKKKVHVDEEKRLEIMIKIDKINNPSKYIKPIHRRRNSTDSQREASEDYDRFDERVFKKEINIERGKNTQQEKGIEYLEEVREAVRRIPKKANSEKPLSLVEKTTDNISEYKEASLMSQGVQSAPSKQKPKIDYMKEIRSKFNLDKKTSKMNDWERVSRSQNYLDPTEKKNNLLRISKKLDDEAKHHELMYNINKKNRNGLFTVEDVESREKIDEMYLESIKAKLAIFDSYKQNNLDQSLGNASTHSQQ